MTDGFCIPLAATEDALALVESVGEDEIGEWLEGAGVDGPGAGGLWVLSFDLDEEDETEEPRWASRRAGCCRQPRHRQRRRPPSRLRDREGRHGT